MTHGGPIMSLQECADAEQRPCKYGDPHCPCQDGDLCHYEGPNPMSPESAAMERARYAWEDIDEAHRRPDTERDNYGRAVGHVSFVTRPALFCSACGSAVQQEVFGAIRREVWCCQTGCRQEGKRLNVYDPVIDGLPHA